MNTDCDVAQQSKENPIIYKGHNNPSEIRIVDENPYEIMFRQSINACSKCDGNGIVIPKFSNEPQICSKCDGHGYGKGDGNAVVVAAPGSCVNCSIM